MGLQNLRRFAKFFSAVIFFLLCFGSLYSIASETRTETLILLPAAETSIYKQNTDSPPLAPKDTELRVGCLKTGGTLDVIVSLLKFNISEIPENSKITSALLHVFSLDISATWDYRLFHARPAPENWNETDPDDFIAFDPTSHVYESRCIPGIPGTSPNLYLWDITDLVRSWIDGTPNYGIVLTADCATYDNYIQFYSSTHLLYKPHIKVVYTAPEAPVPDDPDIQDGSEIPIQAEIPPPSDADTPPLPASDTEQPADGPFVSTSPDLPPPVPPSNTAGPETPESFPEPEKSSPPVITHHPLPRTIHPGNSVVFSVIGEGTMPLYFQWEKDGTAIDYATDQSFTIDSASENDEGAYTCLVFNRAGDARTRPAMLTVKDSVSVIDHPAGLRLEPGMSASFSVAAIGAGPLSFQWKKDHININGATSKNYTIRAVTTEDEGIYSCEVKNEFSNDITNGAKLIVSTPPEPDIPPSAEIPDSPDSEDPEFTDLIDSPVAEPSTATEPVISEKAVEVPKDALDHPLSAEPALEKETDAEEIVPEIPGSPCPADPDLTDLTGSPAAEPDTATAPVISEKAVEAPQYAVIQTLSAEPTPAKETKTDESVPPEIPVLDPPVILRHPESRTLNPGDAINFSVEATGTPPLSFQWQKNEADINGETDQSFTMDSAREKDEGFFSCRVKNNAGSVMSDPAGLIVSDPVKIVSQPIAKTKQSGESVTFSVRVSGTGPFAYQWKKDGMDIPYAILESITLNPLGKEDAGVYSCEISNEFSTVLSDDAALTIQMPPKILGFTSDQTRKSGESVTFSVRVSGTGPFEYQWEKDGMDIPYAILDSITLGPLGKEDAGVYSCKVSNEFSTVLSGEAVLTVIAPPIAPPISRPISRPIVPPGAVPENAVNSPGRPKDQTDQTISKTVTLPDTAPMVLAEKPKNEKAPSVPDKKTTPDPTNIRKPADTHTQKQPSPDFFDLTLTPPGGKGEFVENGSVLTLSGIALPGSGLISAHLEDDQGVVIRDISKSVAIEPDTGRITGSFFVGSFKTARSVRLRVKITIPEDNRSLDGISNRLFVDNTYPEISVTTPGNHARFENVPIDIKGTATDSGSGISLVEISVDGGMSYQPVDAYENGRWRYAYTPKPTCFLHHIKARADDIVGHTTVSEGVIIHYRPLPGATEPLPEIHKTAAVKKLPFSDTNRKDTTQFSEKDGICTYRIISLGNNQFKPSDLFTLDEEMAIIVRGYGGKRVTLRLIDPDEQKVVFELSDFIPVNKNKMWKWKLSKTGIFKAELIVDGSSQDNVFFKIIK